MHSIASCLALLLLIAARGAGYVQWAEPERDAFASSMFADAFPSRLAETVPVSNPSSLLIAGEYLYVSSFLNDAVLRTKLPLKSGTPAGQRRKAKGRKKSRRASTASDSFEVFAHGAYCSRPRGGGLAPRSCGVLNAPWGLAHCNNTLYVSSFGADMVMLFDTASGEFLGHIGDTDTLDSPEGLALSPDGSRLYVASFLDSRVVVFDTAPPYASATLTAGMPVDLEYLESEEAEYTRHRLSGGRASGSGGDGRGGGFGDAASPVVLSSSHHLHGPEDIVYVAVEPGLGRDKLLVTSFYNHSVCVFDAVTGMLTQVLQGTGLEGPMGISVDDENGEILVTSYRASSVVRFDAVSGSYAGIAMMSGQLVGPSSLVLMADGSALVASYETSQLLLFNRTSGYALPLVLAGGTAVRRKLVGDI